MSLAVHSPLPIPHTRQRNCRGAKRKYNYNAVVQGLADGLRPKAIAEQLGTSVRGVEGVLDRLRIQYDLKSTAHLVAHFLRNGWID